MDKIKRCYRCHRDLNDCEREIGRWVKMHKCNGITKKRQKMLIAALGASRLVRSVSNRWTASHSPLFDANRLQGVWAISQNVTWACNEELLVGRKRTQWKSPSAVSITDEGIVVATRVLQPLANCPQCERGGMKLCEAEDEIVGIGCFSCGGMFDAKVLARSWMEQQA